MNNYIFPLPLTAHIIFSIVGLFFFGYLYLRKKYLYHLLLAIAIPSTLLIYACYGNKILFFLFGLEQFILIVSIFVSIITLKLKQSKERKALSTQNTEENDEDSDT